MSDLLMKRNKGRAEFVLRFLIGALDSVDAGLGRANALPDVLFGQPGVDEVFYDLLEHDHENNTLMNKLQYAPVYFYSGQERRTMAPMTQPTIKGVLAELMKRDSINAHQLASKLSDIDPAPPELKKDFQPTIWRILNIPDYAPTLPTLKVLASYFKINTSQLLGEIPLEEDNQTQTLLYVMQVLPKYKKDVLVNTALTLAESEGKKQQ